MIYETCIHPETKFNSLQDLYRELSRGRREFLHLHREIRNEALKAFIQACRWRADIYMVHSSNSIRYLWRRQRPADTFHRVSANFCGPIPSAMLKARFPFRGIWIEFQPDPARPTSMMIQGTIEIDLTSAFQVRVFGIGVTIPVSGFVSRFSRVYPPLL
jgi:hypothetical protein